MARKMSFPHFPLTSEEGFWAYSWGKKYFK